MTGANAQFVTAFIVRSTDLLRRDPRQRQRTARPRCIVNRDTGIGNAELPALFLTRQVGGEIIHCQMVLLLVALPAGAALFQPDIAIGDFAFIQRGPAFKAEASAGQRDVILHPLAEPRLHVDVIGLEP